MSAPATSRTWAMPPGAPSISGEATVWTESRMERGLAPGVQVAEAHGGQVGLPPGQIQVVVDRLDAVGAQTDLAGRLLTRHVQRAVLVARRLRRHVQEERGLAHTGLARDQDDRAGHETAAQDAVQFGYAGGAGRGLAAVDLPDRHRGGGDAARCRRTDRGRAVLLDRAPRLALGAAAQPFGRLPSALGAAVGRPVLRGFRTGSHDGTVAERTDSTGGPAGRGICHGLPLPPVTVWATESEGPVPFEGSFHPYGLNVLKGEEGATPGRLRSHG